MAVFKDTIMINGRPVDVVIDAPGNVLNVQELAEKAWRSVNKEITIGGVTVRVKAVE